MGVPAVGFPNRFRIGRRTGLSRITCHYYAQQSFTVLKHCESTQMSQSASKRKYPFLNHRLMMICTRQNNGWDPTVFQGECSPVYEFTSADNCMFDHHRRCINSALLPCYKFCEMLLNICVYSLRVSILLLRLKFPS